MHERELMTVADCLRHNARLMRRYGISVELGGKWWSHEKFKQVRALMDEVEAEAAKLMEARADELDQSA